MLEKCCDGDNDDGGGGGRFFDSLSLFIQRLFKRIINYFGSPPLHLAFTTIGADLSKHIFGFKPLLENKDKDDPCIFLFIFNLCTSQFKYKLNKSVDVVIGV